eukprot:gene5435-6935_t
MHGGIEINDFNEAVRVIRDCSIVVGMHPDQGTYDASYQAAEHIIDFCLANCKPFAVVPCCVYSKQFPS